MTRCETNLFDETNLFEKLPRHLQGMVAPLSLWEYVFVLLRRIEKLEAAAEGTRP